MTQPATCDSRASLVDALKRGDASSYSLLALGYRDYMLHVATRVLGSPNDAEDVVQAAMLQVWRRVDALQQPAAIRSWLRRITVNAALMHRRRPIVQNEIPTQLIGLRWASSETPETKLAAREEVREALSTLDSLSDIHREVLELRVIRDLDTGDVARRLGISCPAVKVRLHRARAAARAARATPPSNPRTSACIRGGVIAALLQPELGRRRDA